MDVQLRRKKIRDLWYTIQDLIGNASRWPKKIRALFWKKKPKPLGENSSLSFCFPESYKPRYFFEWVDVYRMCDNEKDTKHMKALLDYFKQGRYIRSLYAWNTTTNRFEYLDGTPAYYKRK